VSHFYRKDVRGQQLVNPLAVIVVKLLGFYGIRLGHQRFEAD